MLGAISIAIITSLKDDSGLSTRLSDSHDAQITSAYLVRDVQSADRIWAPTAASTPMCGTGNQVLGLESNLNPGPAIYVSYVTETLGPSPALVRNFCTGTTKSTSTVAHDLGSTSDAVVSLTCSQTDATTCSTDAASAPISSVDIATVQITVTEQSGYQYSLTAAPRQSASGSSGVSPPGSSPPTMLLLGSGQNVLNCAGSGSGTLTVNGVAATDSTSANSDTLTGNYAMMGAQLYTENNSTSVGAYTSTSATPYASGPPIPDPYANLPDPSTSGQPVYTTTNSLPGPGVYTNAVAITSSQTLSSGIYIFEQGISFAGNPSAVIAGTAGVLFFIGIPNAPPGTPQPAQYSVTGNSTISLTAMNTTQNATYAGIVIFQSRTDSNTLNIAGNGTSATYTGLIYAPDAQVNTAGNGTTATGGVISQSLACGGNGGVTIGPTVQTTTTLTSSSTSPTSGQSVTFTAAVSASDGLVPAGSVSFSETPNGSTTATTLCSNVALTNGSATCRTSALTASGSPYTVSATYGGNTTFQTSTGTLAQHIFTATTTTVSAQPPSPTTGQSVVLTAAVNPAPDTGAVTWTITYGSGNSLTCNSTTPLSAGSATCTISAGVLQAASSPYSVSASYGGDTLYAASTGTLNLTVSAATSTTSAAATAPTVTLPGPDSDSATVTGVNGITPTGTVDFYICTDTTSGCSSSTGTMFDAEPLSGGQAASAAYTLPGPGSYCFAAYYLGDSNYAASSDSTADQCFTAS